jgi:hypothetical protein
MAHLPYGVHDFFRMPRWTARSLLWRALHPSARLAEPIFLIGSPRSGTTLAVNLFATHPDVASWSEAGRVWDPVHYHDPEAEHYWTADDLTPGHARRLHRWCEWYRQAHGKARFVNKHPRNSLRIGYLRAVFPDARAVVSSILSQVARRERRQKRPMGGFAKPPGWRALLRDDLAEQTALQWQAIVRLVREQRAALGPAYLEVRYEELCARPRDTYRELFRFAGLRSDDAALAGIPERLEESEGWRERLTPDQLTSIDKAAGDLLRELGYR